MIAVGRPSRSIATGALISRRSRTLLLVGALTAGLIAVVVAGALLTEAAETPDLLARQRPPSLSHPFGTDWLGRDQLSRTLVGLRLSLLIGAVASTVSAVVALLAGSAAGVLGRRVDASVSWLVDLFLSVPHLVLLILVSFAVGGGVTGVIVAVGVTHWPSLTRVLRGEARQVASEPYVMIARRLGQPGPAIARRHILPHLLPQFAVGLVLQFPHAILHEASLSFLGLGLPPHSPAVGILLADSMRYLSTGAWWLAALPGLALLVVVKAVDTLGEQLRLLTDPRSAHL
jgi:peptide/nickel transport system permease protein